MPAHGGDENLLGNLEEVGIEGAEDRARVLDQVRDLFDQLGVGENLPLGPGGEPLDFATNDGLALEGIGDDEMAGALLKVMGEIPHRKRGVGHEAMAAGGAAAGDVAETEGDDGAAEESDDPVHRAGETDVEILPAHRFFEGDGGDQAREDFPQQHRRRAAGLLFVDADVGALLRLHQLQRLDSDPLAAGKAFGGLGRLAVGAKGDRLGRPHGPARQIGLMLVDPGHHQDQTARRRQGADVAVPDAGAIELLADDGFHIQHRLGEKSGGDLLGTDFEKEFLDHLSGLLSAAGSRDFHAI